MVDEWMQFKNQKLNSPKDSEEDDIIMNEVTFVDRKNNTVYSRCHNCKSDIEYSIEDFDNRKTLCCPNCDIEFYANPFSKNIK